MLSAITRRYLSAVIGTSSAAAATGASEPLPSTPNIARATADRSASGQGKRGSFAQPGLEGLRIAAYNKDLPGEQGNQPAAIGHVVAQLSSRLFAVDFKDSPATTYIGLGSRVYAVYEREEPGLRREDRAFLIGGLVVRVNLNGTFGLLLDNNKVDLVVPQEKIAITEGVCKFLQHPRYLEVVEWVRSAGLDSDEEVRGTACILYHRGWRAERLYLLEAPDIRSMTHLSKSARMSIMEKAEWQRDHHRQMRSIYKERVKERDRRYMFSKYAGIYRPALHSSELFRFLGGTTKII